MITHHPTDDLLLAFAAGELSSSLSVAIATHTEMCPVCRHQIERYTNELAENNLIGAEEFNPTAANTDDFIIDASLENIFNNIVSESEAPLCKHESSNCSSDELAALGDFVLPATLKNLSLSKFVNVGKLSRARISLGEEPVRTSLLHINAGGKVPEHTHKGFEITLLLEGTFEDEMGKYQPGDFIILDGKHKHHPVSKEGCWCLTVVNDSVKFTKGINRVLNPLGKLIY